MPEFGIPTLIELNSLEEHAALCASLGLRFVEINLSFPLYRPERLGADMLNALRERWGVYFTVHLDESADVCCPNRRVAAAYLDEITELASLAREASIPSLNLHLQRGVYVTLPGRRTYIYAETEERYLSDMRVLRERFTEAARGADVHLNIENTDGYDLPFLRGALEVLLESPAFGLTYDVGHDAAIGWRDRDVILSYPGRLRHMHLHDARGKSVHLALGDGELDVPSFIRLADENACRVVLETKTVEALKSSVDYLKRRGEL